MDKIKTVKIKNPDGSVSEETYTISVDAKDVDMKNGKDLQDTIGDINVDRDGSIAEQLGKYKDYDSDIETLYADIDSLEAADTDLENDIIDLQVNKINKTDIIDNLNSSSNTKVLSAKQGKVLGDAVAALEAENVKKKAYFFDTVADMKAANLKDGDYACTLGYYSANDGGAAEYKIVDSFSGYKENLNNELYAELIIKKENNIKQFGAYGDDNHDDTNIFQYVFNNYDNIYIPTGTYKITNEINIKSNLYLHGDGQNTILKSYFTYNNENIKYILKSDSSSVAISRAIIEKIKFVNNTPNTLSGGIYIEYSTRGIVLNDLWFDSISNSIKLGDKIWGLCSLNNIFSLYLPNQTDENINTLSFAIYCRSNAIFGNNIEIIGKNKYGLYLKNCQVGAWKNLNISGSSSSYLMQNAILIEDCKDIEVNTGWFEQLDDGAGKLTKTINILNSEQIFLNTMHISSGSIFIDGSNNIKVLNSHYYSSSTGLRYMNNSNIVCDLISLGYCNYQSNIDYTMGIITIIDMENESNENIKNNPLYFLGIQEDLAVTNGSFVTKTSDTVNQLTGDRCFNFNCTSNQGGQINTSSLFEVGKTYTILAYVKPINNIKTLAISNEGSATVTDYPNQTYKNIDNNTNYHLIRKTLTVNNATSSIKILATLNDTSIRGDFIIDSVFITEGKHNNQIPCALSKTGLLKTSKIVASVVPWTGTWSKGDMVYNNFVSSSNDGILAWVYDGTNWTSISKN